ncbi:MAG TPA: DUF397 domain-containing protein [Actinophytocola sp.]
MTSWRKSSFSGSGDLCVEVACVPAGIAVRDSKDPDGPMLTFPRLDLLSPATRPRVLRALRAPSAPTAPAEA